MQVSPRNAVAFQSASRRGRARIGQGQEVFALCRASRKKVRILRKLARSRKLRPSLRFNNKNQFAADLDLDIGDSVHPSTRLQLYDRVSEMKWNTAAYIGNQEPEKGFGTGQHPTQTESHIVFF